jgi:hypothetical protein
MKIALAICLVTIGVMGGLLLKKSHDGSAITNVQSDADKVSAKTESLCGIYRLRDRYEKTLSRKMDLRSDGTAILTQLYNDFEIRRTSEHWGLEFGNVVSVGRTRFKIEGDDLIQGQDRWLRTR